MSLYLLGKSTVPNRKFLAAAALLLVGALFGWLANAGWQITGVQAQDKHPATKPRYARDTFALGRQS
jgi:hypothetical protein